MKFSKDFLTFYNDPVVSSFLSQKCVRRKLVHFAGQLHDGSSGAHWGVVINLVPTGLDQLSG